MQRFGEVLYIRNGEVNMNYKIVVDSCCELPEEYLNDEAFERIPFQLG